MGTDLHLLSYKVPNFFAGREEIRIFSKPQGHKLHEIKCHKQHSQIFPEDIISKSSFLTKKETVQLFSNLYLWPYNV